MTEEAFSAANPADVGGLSGAMQTILGKFLQNVDDCLPATVVSYDRLANVATVRPLVAVLTTEGASVPRAAVASVPVFSFGCGRFVVNFPLKGGDLGWIKANDRDISLFAQSLKEAKPNTLRKHSFQDGVFFPDAVRTFTIDGEDFDENMVIQTQDGKIRVSIWPDRVKTTAENTWLEVNKDGTITGTAPKEVFFDTPLVRFAGGFATGSKYPGTTSTMNGGLKTTGDVVAGGVSTINHPHTGVQPGGGTTGAPVAGG